MTVARRLFLAMIPAVLGVLSMAGLAWWGQRGRQVPEWVLLAGILAAVASLALAWHGTRYVARRVESLSRLPPTVPPAPERAEERAEERADELDSIARRIAEAERSGETRARAAEARMREHAGLLEDAVATLRRALDEVRLPLHILLASPFGALNENQEEMIGAAQAAAEEADAALRRIGRVAGLDGGSVDARPELVRLHDLLAPLLASVAPRLERAGARLEIDIPPLLPSIHVDPGHAREALALVLDRVASHARADARIPLTADAVDGGVRLRWMGAALRADDAFPLAERLLHLQGATLRAADDGTIEIILPSR